MAAATSASPDPKADKAAPAPSAAAKSKKKFGGRRVKIAAIVLAVMALQAVAAILLLPKGQTNSGHAAETTASSEESHGSKTEKSDDLVEMEIDKFSCSIELDDGIIWHVSFKLYAGVASNVRKHFEEAINETYRARVRQAVVKVIRMSSVSDLREPGLELLKSKLQREINNVLPQRYIQEIIVSEIKTMQQ